MKKVYLSIVAILALATSALAQKNLDIEVLLKAPAENAVINCNDSFSISYSFVNHGPDGLLTGDTLRFQDPECHPDSVWYDVLEVDFNMGDTIEIYSGMTHFNMTKSLFNETSDTLLGVPFANGKYNYYVFLALDTNFVKDPVPSNNIDRALITIDCPNSTNEINKSTSLNVYPNPTSNNISFSYDFTTAANATVRVMDLMGRTLITKDFGKQAVGTNNFTLDVATLSNGVYYVEITSGDVRGVCKFTVSK